MGEGEKLPWYQVVLNIKPLRWLAIVAGVVVVFILIQTWWNINHGKHVKIGPAEWGTSVDTPRRSIGPDRPILVPPTNSTQGPNSPINTTSGLESPVMTGKGDYKPDKRSINHYADTNNLPFITSGDKFLVRMVTENRKTKFLTSIDNQGQGVALALNTDVELLVVNKKEEMSVLCPDLGFIRGATIPAHNGIVIPKAYDSSNLGDPDKFFFIRAAGTYRSIKNVLFTFTIWYVYDGEDKTWGNSGNVPKLETIYKNMTSR